MLSTNEMSAQPNFQAIFESIPGLYLILSPNLDIIAVSDAYLQATMTIRENILGKGLFEIFPDNPNDPAATGTHNLGDSLKRVKQTLKADTMAVQKYDIRKSEDRGGGFEERFWSPVNTPIIDKNSGKLLYIIHRVEDVTEFMRLKRQELQEQKVSGELRERTIHMEAEIYTRSQELRQMVGRYETLTSLITVGIFHTDASGNCLYVNDSWSKITQTSIDQVKGKHWLSRIHPDDYQETYEEWKKFTLERISSKFKKEFRFLLNEAVIWVIGEVQIELDEDEDIKGYVGTVTDITDRKHLERLQLIEQAEREQRQRAELAEQHKARLVEFTDTVCHEIRNPLNGIYGSLVFLEETINQLEVQLNSVPSFDRNNIVKVIAYQRELVDSIKQCAQHQKLVVDDVLDLSRIEMKKMEIRSVPFDPKLAIHSAAQMFKHQLKEKGLTLTLKLPEAEAIVMGDPVRLNQVLINLLSNAIKYTYVGGITITLLLQPITSSQTLIQIEMTDTGIGMTAEELSQLFRRFSQTNQLNSQYGGFGLGLSIVKNLLETMGGNIAVESKKGEGSKFTFKITYKKFLQNELAEQTEINPAEEKIATKPQKFLTPKRVLIVEDNVINQKLLARYLTSFNCSYGIAQDGVEAVEKFNHGDFDVILMDIQMPRLNGFEATKQIREKEKANSNFRSIPIIGLSGNVGNHYKEMAQQIGMNDYLTKPYMPSDIFKCLARFIPDEPVNTLQSTTLPPALASSFVPFYSSTLFASHQPEPDVPSSIARQTMLKKQSQ